MKRRNPQSVTVLTADDEEVAGGNPLPVTLAAADLGIGRVKVWDGTDVALVSAAGGLNVDGSAVTQPVSAAALPLPSGAATGAKQDDQTTALQIMDDWDEADRAKVNPIAGQVGVQGASGVVTALTQRVVLATDVALPAGTAAVGKLLPPDIDVTAHANYAKKYYTNAGAVTDGIIWSPAAGKRWHVTTLFINISAAATITLEDDKSGGDEAIWKAELAANSGVMMVFDAMYPFASGEDAADLIITTSAGNVFVTCVGYEV